ncbi:MAG: prepilin-type N-terminal cleavage/methylation domain-containing protein [Candidatus Aminicenantia bacterium]
MRKKDKKENGFSFIETIVAVFLLSLALLVLAQLFILGLVNNAHSDVVTNANFLAQQQIDVLRNLTLNDLSTWMNNSPVIENLDLNSDGINEFRRETDVIVGTPGQFLIWVRVYSELNTFGDPSSPKADIRTIVSR